MAAFLLLAAVLSILVAVYLLWTYSYWYRKGVPQGNPLCLFGGMNDFALSRTDYLTLYKTAYKKYTKYPFHGVYNFLEPNLFLCDPELIKAVLTKYSHLYPDTSSQITEDVDPIFAKDPFFQVGQEWKENRSNFSVLMTPARLRQMQSKMVDASNLLVQHIRNLKHKSGKGDGADIKDILSRFSTEASIAILLGGKAGCFEEKKNLFLEMAQSVFEDTFERNLAMICIIGAPHIAKFLKLRVAPKKMATILTKIIQDEIQKRKSTDHNYDALLDAILKRAEKAEDKELAMKDINALVITFFIEGFESTSLSGTYLLLNLAKNPEIQENLRQKIFEIAPPGKEFPDDLVNELPYLQNCIMESMRLLSTVTLLQRKTGQDNTLTASTGEEVLVKKGTIVDLPIFPLSHDPRIFPDPESYDPDRFLDEAQKRMFTAFGDGPRQCLGRRYSMQLLGTMVAAVLREFRVELSPKVKFPLTFSNHPFFLYPSEKIHLRLVPL